MPSILQQTSSRICSFVRSCLTPSCIKTNRNTGLIRLIACLTMLCDHAGKMLFPQYPVMRIIGRLAFPLFAYGIAVGAVCTRNPIKYLTRICLLALLCQPLYALGLAHENSAMYSVPFLSNPVLSVWTFYLNSWKKPSILLSLALGLALLLSLRERRWVFAAALYMLCEIISPSLDYGIRGIRLMLLFYLLCEHPLLAFGAYVAFALNWGQGSGYLILGHRFGIQIFTMPAALLLFAPMKSNLKLPRWFVYGFYPGHLALLAVLSHL